MKRRITVSIALVLSVVFVSLTRSDSTAQAQRNRSYVYDSGIVQLGPNQTLIGLLVPAIAAPGSGNSTIRSRKMQYSQGSCTGSLCKHSVASETISDPVSLAIGEGMSDVCGLAASSSAVRIVFVSNNPNLRANGQIIDTVSGAVVSSFSWGESNSGSG